MKTSTAVVGVILALITQPACTKLVVGKKDDAQLKKHSNHWGLPKMRPVVWGFTGIERDCAEADCPQTQK